MYIVISHNIIGERAIYKDSGPRKQNGKKKNAIQVMVYVRRVYMSWRSRKERYLRSIHAFRLHYYSVVFVGLLERLTSGEYILCAEGYLLEFESRCYLQGGAYVPEVVLENSHLLRALHQEFVHAGSDVVEALTVRTIEIKNRLFVWFFLCGIIRCVTTVIWTVWQL